MAKAQIEQIVSLKDERLAIDQIDQYRLSFFISADACQIGIKDLRKKQLLLLEDINFDLKKNITENLEALHADHILISAGFWKEIQVFFRNKKFSLVPNPVFDANKAYAYVRLNEPTNPNKDIYESSAHQELGLNIAFGFEQDIKDWFDTKYPNINTNYFHQASAYLNAVGKNLKEKAQASLYLHLQGNHALIAGFNLSKLALYNQFLFNNTEHLVKLTALSCQQFSTDRSKTPLVLTGNQEQVDAYQSTLKKYFKLIELGQRPDDLLIHPVFNELEPYEYNEILANL